MEKKTNGDMMEELEQTLKPYRDSFPSYTRLPHRGRNKHVILAEMQELKSREESKWKDGFVSGAVYHGDQEHIDFLNKVYALNSQSNPLHSDVWPSTTKFEAEVVAMTAHMLGANEVAGDPASADEVCGVVSSGGTESILLAMKTYRDWARAVKGIREPEMIVPTTAHAAFDKAAQYFQIKMIRIPVNDQFKADVAQTAAAITPNTVVLVGSAPSFPHGTIDPIAELSELARQAGVGFHTDACLGGFILPWAAKLGYAVPSFDFRLPGVTSISVDTHKYGYAAKGSSVILYRNPQLRRHQFYTTSVWPGGFYLSPTFAGSRPGALSATAWAAMVAIGEQGYMEIAKKILETAAVVKEGIAAIPELYVLGDPLWDIAFGSQTLDIYKIMDHMSAKNWSLNGLQDPPAVHICLTHRHTQPGLAERFIADLQAAVEQVKQNPDQETGGVGRLYGLSAQIPVKDVIDEFLKQYIDLLYKV
ncbi:MAG: aminotransferase class V-fold PLP-dependent enzyme [Desulfobacterales bacterium]|nr:MAG: aminotransferase class V-fold PLP-dependent enzyme [Desulfobacterales bacterium]